MTLFRGKTGGFLAFLGIAALVAGGLGWVTRETLQMEEERHVAHNAREWEKLQKEQDDRFAEKVRQAEVERVVKMRLALVMLDNRITPALAREDSRPYPQYLALSSPFPALARSGFACLPGEVYVPSPLLTAELPDWMLLHFQVDPVKGWISPQVIPEETQKMLRRQPIELALNNVDAVHKDRLEELKAAYPTKDFFADLSRRGLVDEKGQLHSPEFLNPSNTIGNNSIYGLGGQNGYQNFAPPIAPPIPNDKKNDPPEQAAPRTGGQFGQGGQLGQGGGQFGQGGQLGQGGGQFGQFGNGDPTNSRYQNSARAMNDGMWTYLNDARNYSYTPLDHLSSSKVLESKQTEVRAVDKQYRAATDPAQKKELSIKLDGLKKEADDLKKIALQPVEVELSSMKPIWLPDHEHPKHLLMVRPARVGEKLLYQGILLDWTKLQAILKPAIEDVFPQARLVPREKTDPNRLDREMYVLPVELDPGPIELPEHQQPVESPPRPSPGWTPLRIGLAVAWGAALIALFAVGLGGWSLLDFSERRIRFVSAVTHELRTPLTTLRLYLDMLTSGLIREEKQREEYIQTLSGEADRLHRLIGNVLDFARLEKTRPTIENSLVPIAELLEQLHGTWNERCAASGKELRIANACPADFAISTDRNLVEQILGNLIDNARKYSQDSADPFLGIRAFRDGGKLVVEVEDRGPGVTKRERGSIFRPFRRGHDADVKAGGVGLGLALATRWASFIGGRLSVRSGEGGVGACFRLELPG